MKAVILAGGMGSRLAEETDVRPKPMVEIGGKPIIWHIMKIYSAHGINDFVICLGTKGYVIKEYFANYFLHVSDVVFDIANNRMEVLQRAAEPWRVSLVETGLETMTGGRLARVRDLVSDGDFCFTYGDGVGDMDITRLVAFHREQGRLATMTAVAPPGRFGSVRCEDDRVTAFEEKPAGDGGLINGGFFVLSPRCIDLITSDATVWEEEPLSTLTAQGQLSAFRHAGFWHPMDTLRDRRYLERLWQSGDAPWKVW